jgi:hypothetical protein
MFITNHDTRKAESNSLIKWLLLITINLLAITQLAASELNDERYSISQGSLKKEFNDQQRNKNFETNKLNKTPDQLNGRASSKTREAMLNNQTKQMKKASKRLLSNSRNKDYTADFSIYGAVSLLQDDYDGDGFYQTFSVVFDADIHSYTENQFGEVYALLYISKNGGPWTHYFTTDSFIIEGDTDLDEYEVITTFLSGYSSDHYDILIDLYQEGYSDLVATYSSDDSNALYALSLESADYDEPYVDSYVEVTEVHGGSIYWLSLLILSACLIRSRLNIFNYKL